MLPATPTRPPPSVAPTIKISDYDLREDLTALQLGAEQRLNATHQKVAQMLKEGRSFHSPSKLKYAFLFVIAAAIDIVDLADLTGIGIIISKIVSIGGTAIICFIFWLTDGKVKRAQVYSDDALIALMEWQQTVSQYSRLAMQASGVLRKIPGLKRVARSIPRAMVKLRRIARRNPLTKVLIGGAINLVPWLAIVNLMVFWIYLSYRDEKKTFQEARKISQQIAEEIAIPQVA